MPENLREIVLGILTEIGENGTYSHTAIRAALDRYQYFSKRDRAFITKVCEGTVERMIEIDYIIDCYSTVPVEKMKPVIREILRSAVYQIRFMGGIPDSAAVNEAVRLTQKHGFYNLKGFVNGVLRSIIRNEDSIPYPDSKKEPVRYLSVKYSMPEWLVSSWLDEFGPFVTGKMLESCLIERPTTVRLKTDNITKKVILDSMREQNVTVKRAPYLPYAYNISDYNYLPGLKAFQNGWIFPQDVSSMLVAEAAAPKRGDYVIDVCAAPGGKSLHIADKMGGYGMVEARDLSEEKVKLIADNVKRADLINVKPVVMDALTLDMDSVEKADIVICDLPCSGLGVISRKSDIKYRVSPEKINSLVDLQRQILKNAVRYVKPGGTLIYSTCTVGHRENQDNVAWITEHYPFVTDSLNPYLPRELWRLTTEQGYLQLLQGVHDSDGFFIARLKRKDFDKPFPSEEEKS
ncbi:MAG: 16S rRNA (cytosine(967)-C(5))-methyltransferase RsmB [Eubacteriales bacterium]|jgi:16S rRNA (cytosine967-C5)-methyltransferase|nr:16S rRNA (cytosine(967)-C(5))-methyltransferase RsmB [Lachnospiraceae bacterium]MDD5860663.1 16S rRNA (cytosine(967)-C(5))-methyltransferase RsmB [Eubacteriales bacterium]MCH4064425.1 16S rRNA (cytosine(967)-C(5))-methyltransferase RsmB [Lachnospiraceae bacterium]MCH4102850.1 16S rRNA (cytosine(967)-C(5))-methyltransferase RsmB [Lachnospiraceae bacterium]MCI1308701.1 16S rRNA (cytosine(967)-C(5))-methyltransferase RsmB [Lachnospiraceae bacterium]